MKRNKRRDLGTLYNHFEEEYGIVLHVQDMEKVLIICNQILEKRKQNK